MNPLRRLATSALAALMLTSLAVPYAHADTISPSDIVPFVTPGEGVQTTTAPFGTVQSFGFYFDANGPGRFINALGFSAQAPWLTTNLTYSVQLWSWASDPFGFTPLAQLSFSPSSPGVLAGGYYWKPLPARIDLDETAGDPSKGYVVAAIGNFTSGNLVELGEDVSFSSLATYDVNGFNADSFPYFPAPAFDGGQYGYWNANISLGVVPEPSTYAMALAGIACGGYSMWRRRKRA